MIRREPVKRVSLLWGIVTIPRENGSYGAALMLRERRMTLAGQRERINRDPVLSEAVACVSVSLTRQSREMLCLPLTFVPGWLSDLNVNCVKQEGCERMNHCLRER